MYNMYQLSRFGHFVDQKTWNSYSGCNERNDQRDRNPRIEADAAKKSANTPHAIPSLTLSPPARFVSHLRKPPRRTISPLQAKPLHDLLPPLWPAVRTPSFNAPAMCFQFPPVVGPIDSLDPIRWHFNGSHFPRPLSAQPHRGILRPERVYWNLTVGR